jgi:hypothetical protein
MTPARLMLTLAMLTLVMLSSIAAGCPEQWMLLAIGTSWAPFLTLILIPLLTRRPLLHLSLVRQVPSG